MPDDRDARREAGDDGAAADRGGAPQTVRPALPPEPGVTAAARARHPRAARLVVACLACTGAIFYLGPGSSPLPALAAVALAFGYAWSALRGGPPAADR
jgi:hypothetical protein